VRSSNGEYINLGDMLAECVAARIASQGVAINGVQCACARSLVRQKQVMRPLNHWIELCWAGVRGGGT
jgi:hypothetical protein